jgi:hypothetical protein
MIGCITPCTFTQFGTTGDTSAITILHTFQFIVARAQGFSVFNNRILATDLSQSHCHLKSHAKSSCHRLIPFVPFLQLPIPKIRLDCSQLLFDTSTSPVKVKVKVTLRLKVSQSVFLCVELMTRYLLLFDSCGLVFWGALSGEGGSAYGEG